VLVIVHLLEISPEDQPEDLDQSLTFSLVSCLRLTMATDRPQLVIYTDTSTRRRLKWALLCQARAVGHPAFSKSEMVRQMLQYALTVWEGVYGPPPAEFEPLPGPPPPEPSR